MSRWARRSLLAALALTLAAAGLGACEASTSAGGPLVAPPPHGWTTTKPVGFVFTDGVETLELAGTRPAVLRKVESVGTDGLRVVGVALVKPGRRIGTIQEIDGWPPKDRDLRPSDVVTPAVGATFTTKAQNALRQSYELLVGIKVVKPGYLVRDGFRITYEVDGKTYQRYFPAQLAVCTSKRLEQAGEGCPIPADTRS